ncbi:DUF1772 domain-containing protein [Gordonia sp. X0973]|uniref:anthrone oxygenase family protein n=1 Tax=Gordonia sp. X0973 TaxID=2742602 RepID=UPI000F5356F4|nr:anthrone oxygenase family protein [Gordonia sp. X0973]QKT06735.1 DUF1772 domain-containing protein [Gordonia sp. X0973]
MELVFALTATAGILAIAVIFGTDVLAAVVLRSVYADVDDRTLVQAVGRGHYYGDRRLPVVGVLGVVMSAATAAVGFLHGSTAAGSLAAVALAMLLIWLVLFTRISKPINKALTDAALSGTVPADARALQQRWESIITIRSVLQGLAILLLCVALALI